MPSNSLTTEKVLALESQRQKTFRKTT